MVTRQPGHPDTDVLLFATQSNLRAYVLAVEAGPGSKPRLLWSVDVSGPDRSQWSADGQLAPLTFDSDRGSCQFGVGVMVTGCALEQSNDRNEIVCQNVVSFITG